VGRRDIGHPAPRTAPFEVHPASAVLGAEIVGVDLAPTVDDVTAENLREALWTHKVLVFRDQHLAPDAHVRAVEIFDHPQWLYRHQDNRLVYVFELDKPGAAAAWHVGGTWRNPPFELESLTYQVVPEIGGRTLWADLQAATPFGYGREDPVQADSVTCMPTSITISTCTPSRPLSATTAMGFDRATAGTCTARFFA